MKAVCFRTLLVGGGNSYDVYIPTKYKEYKPITCGIYATVIHRGDGEYYHMVDFLRNPEIDNLPALTQERLDAFRALEKRASDIEIRLAQSVFPELIGREKLPLLWTNDNFPSKEISVEFNLD